MAMNKDFYRNLPGMVCIMLDKYITKYKKEPWFPEAWEEYRQHILNSSMNDMKMPGYVFNKYVKKDTIKHFAAQDSLYELFHQDSDVIYGVPQQKKFPLPDADHIRSAIKFFNYVEPKYEAQLAKAIIARAKTYGVDLSEMNIGDENRFKKYLAYDELKHWGIKGQKWGVRNYENYDGTLTPEGKIRYGQKAEKLKKKINIAEKRRAVHERMAKTAQAKADKYRKESSQTKPKNFIYGLGRKLAQKNLDEEAKEYAKYAESGRKEVENYMKKIGNDPYLSLNVYLGEIWGLPYDYYDVQVHNRRK